MKFRSLEQAWCDTIQGERELLREILDFDAIIN